jgi:hypothetical protein
VPVEFNFGLEARFLRQTEPPPSSCEAARSLSSSTSTVAASTLNSNVRPVPDFAALQAAHAAAVTTRRAAAIHPTVPQVFHFGLDARLKEREAFEEARREREAELARQAEERRRAQEEEEERQYREARRRTVPKANTVPDWYRDAPRRHRG